MLARTDLDFQDGETITKADVAEEARDSPAFADDHPGVLERQTDGDGGVLQ